MNDIQQLSTVGKWSKEYILVLNYNNIDSWLDNNVRVNNIE